MNITRRYSISVCFVYGLEEKHSKSEVIFAVCRLPLTSCLTSLMSYLRGWSAGSFPEHRAPFPISGFLSRTAGSYQAFCTPEQQILKLYLSFLVHVCKRPADNSVSKPFFIDTETVHEIKIKKGKQVN